MILKPTPETPEQAHKPGKMVRDCLSLQMPVKTARMVARTD